MPHNGTSPGTRCAENSIPCKYFDVSAKTGVNIGQMVRELVTVASRRPMASPGRALRTVTTVKLKAPTDTAPASETCC